LLDAATDKDWKVQEQVRKSVLTLGKQHPDRVLAICQDYLLKHPKLSVAHRVVILQTIELIASSKIEQISYPKIKSIISLASDEMTRSKEVIPDWQQAASNVLVAVGKKHINDIMEEILSKFQPGLLPHFFVVQTLASLSDSNVYGMVPFLNAILGTMLPMLNMAKQDNMKWVFSSALCHFSDSILEYLANLDKAPDPTVRKDTFSSEIYAAFDILFNNWLQSRESKLRLTVAEAVGSMSHLMANEKLEEQIPKLIPAILSLYKKNSEHYIISKSLCQVLDASVSMGSRVLETQVDSLLVALHQQISAPVDYSNPPTVKNHNEVLRCFTLLANSFPDRLVMFVLQKLENSNERSRVGSLAVLRHLINSSTSTMESKKLLILASIRQPMADHSNKAKHTLMSKSAWSKLSVRWRITVTWSWREGSCWCDSSFNTAPFQTRISLKPLRTSVRTAVTIFPVLWPKLLYYLTPPVYSNATTPLCKSLIVLGTKKKENEDPSFKIDFTQEVNLPSPQTLLVRMFVNAALPFNSRGHGAPSLSLLQILSVSIHPKTESLWEKEIPLLLSVLEESTAESLDKKQWNEKLLKLLSKTLATIDDGKWVCQLAAEATGYLPTYNHALEEKSFLYQCIGVILQQCFNKEVVKKQLQEILLTARHNDAIEREGVAMGVGLCANSHLEGTLAKLEEYGKSDAFKKSPSIFNLLKVGRDSGVFSTYDVPVQERNDVEVEKVKSTLILCYGQVALNAPPETILNHIDQDILRSISKHFNTKDLTMKLSLIQSIGLIAKAISRCVKKQGYIFTRKQELINVMLDFIKAEPADSLRTQVRPLVIITCANLFSFSFVMVGVVFFFLLTCLASAPLGASVLELYKDTLAALQELLKSVLAKDPTPDGLQNVFKHIEPWLSSAEDHERERAVTATSHMFAYYLDNLNVKNMVSFHNLGALLGRLSPRCSDPHPDVRLAAIDCVYTLLYIQLRYEGFSFDYKDDAVDSLLPLKENLKNPDHSVLYKTCSDLTKVHTHTHTHTHTNTSYESAERLKLFMNAGIFLVLFLCKSQPNPSPSPSRCPTMSLPVPQVMSKRLPQQQLTTLVFMLFEGLIDSQTNCCRASSVILNTILKSRGGGLQELVTHTHTHQTGIFLHSVASFQNILNTYFTHQLYWFTKLSVCMCLHMCQVPEMLEVLHLRLQSITEEQMTCGLKELLLNGQSQETAVSLFPRLFSCLMVRLGASVGVSAGKQNNKHAASFHVAGVAAEALQILLARAQLDEVIKRLEEEKAWDAIKEQNTHISGVTLLARAMSKHAGPRLPAIVECLCPSLNNIYECQRITVTTFFSELLNHHVVTELMLIDVLMNNMMERISDPCCTVRMLAVRGLGNIAVGSPEKVNKYAKELLAAMSSGMEEKDDPGKLITLEAMSGLSKVLLYLDKKNVHLLVVYIFMKIKPFLECENDEIRCASICLMGNLSKFGSGEQVFKDQIHNVLVSLLLHLVDPNPQVVKACKFAMRVCAPVVGSEQITAMFQNHLHDDKSLHYGEFINDLTKYLIQDFPGMLNFYHISVIQFFKSNWPEVRAGAAMFIGFLLGNLPEEHLSHLNMGSITKGLVMLLQDPDPVVRVKAAEAMGHFH
ncbi:unnamed protein product, partial [Tetraodon nigroviridis]